MKKTFILTLALTSTVMAEQSTLDKFNALVMNIHQGSDEYFVNIPSKTFAEDKVKQEYFDDKYFTKAMTELHGKKIYQLRLRKSQVSDSSLNVLAQFPTIKELELSNSKITDNGIKKIVEFCPQLKRLNVWGCTNITDKSLYIYEICGNWRNYIYLVQKLLGKQQTSIAGLCNLWQQTRIYQFTLIETVLHYMLLRWKNYGEIHTKPILIKVN